MGVVHRLDTGVSGLMVFARTPEAAAALSRQITQSQNAYAVQDGRAEGKIAARSSSSSTAPSLQGGRTKHCPPRHPAGLAVQGQPQGPGVPGQPPRKGVREAVLEYRILQTAGDTSLADITLHTGRTHQIRVQFACRKHPLSGDGKYGSQ